MNAHEFIRRFLLPAPHPTGRVPPRPLLRLPRQRPPSGKAGTLPDATRGSRPSTDARSSRPGDLPGTVRSLPVLRRRDDHARQPAAPSTTSTCLLARRLMSNRRRHATGPWTPDAIRTGKHRVVHRASVDPIWRRSGNPRARRTTTQSDRPPAARRPALRPSADCAGPGIPFRVSDLPTEPQSP